MVLFTCILLKCLEIKIIPRTVVIKNEITIPKSGLNGVLQMREHAASIKEVLTL